MIRNALDKHWLLSDAVRSRRLFFFGHLSVAYPCQTTISRFRQSWLRTMEAGLYPLDLGLAMPQRRAQDRAAWRRLVTTAESKSSSGKKLENRISVYFWQWAKFLISSCVFYFLNALFIQQVDTFEALLFSRKWKYTSITMCTKGKEQREFNQMYVPGLNAIYSVTSSTWMILCYINLQSHHGRQKTYRLKWYIMIAAIIKYKCTKHQFIHLLTATCNEWHIENSKNHKKVISLTTTSSNCQCAVE